MFKSIINFDTWLLNSVTNLIYVTPVIYMNFRTLSNSEKLFEKVEKIERKKRENSFYYYERWEGVGGNGSLRKRMHEEGVLFLSHKLHGQLVWEVLLRASVDARGQHLWFNIRLRSWSEKSPTFLIKFENWII